MRSLSLLKSLICLLFINAGFTVFSQVPEKNTSSYSPELEALSKQLNVSIFLATDTVSLSNLKVGEQAIIVEGNYYEVVEKKSVGAVLGRLLGAASASLIFAGIGLVVSLAAFEDKNLALLGVFLPSSIAFQLLKPKISHISSVPRFVVKSRGNF